MTVKAQEFVDDFLEHYSRPDYDPAKAKAYYERTKRLKGRNQGSGTPDTSPRETGGSSSSSSTPAERAAKRAETNKAKVKAIRGKIDKVSKHVDALLKERRSRGEKDSDSDKKSEKSTDKKEKSSTEKDDKPAEKLSASEKAEKNKKARDKYQEEHPQEPSDMTVEELDEKIATGRRRVKELKARLRDTLEQNRS